VLLVFFTFRAREDKIISVDVVLRGQVETSCVEPFFTNGAFNHEIAFRLLTNAVELRRVERRLLHRQALPKEHF
jgi:hypothetical protein